MLSFQARFGHIFGLVEGAGRNTAVGELNQSDRDSRVGRKP